MRVDGLLARRRGNRERGGEVTMERRKARTQPHDDTMEGWVSGFGRGRE